MATATPVPQELFGGLYTEATPESLPVGASPLSINTDYMVGSVTPRPGKQSVYSFANSFVEKLTTFAQSIAGAFAPNEQPWSNPNNASVGVPGTYATTVLNAGSGATGQIATLVDTNTGSTSDSVGPLSSLSPVDIAIITGTAASPPVFTPGTLVFAGSGTATRWDTLPSTKTYNATFTAGIGFSGAAAGFSSNGAFAVSRFVTGNNGAGIFPFTTAAFSPSGVPVGHSIIVTFGGIKNSGTAALTVTDNAGNIYTQVAFAESAGGRCVSGIWVCLAPTGSPTTITINQSGGNWAGNSINSVAMDVTGLTSPAENVSQILQASNFGFTIPSTTKIIGAEIEISGHQTSQPADAILSANLLTGNGTKGTVETGQLPLADAQVVLGIPTETWGLKLTPDVLNDPNFSVQLVASASEVQAFYIYAVRLKIFTTPDPAPSFNYIKTFSETGGEVLTLALGSDGTIYQEDVNNSPGVLASVYTAIAANSFAQSATQDDREFIAISDLSHGTDIPYTYTPPNFDRLSQVGPGAPPSASTTSSQSNIVSITQPTPKSDPEFPNHLSGILWSAGPGNTAAGNVLTVYYARTTAQAQDTDLQPGVGVTIAGADTANPNNNFNGQPIDGNYTVISVGQGIPPGAQFARWYFTVQVPSTQSVNQANHQEGHGPDGTYQVTTATMTTAQQLPNVEVNSSVQIAGTGGSPPAGYDGTQLITETPNAAQLQITSTQLSGNVATYGFNLISGTNPAVGQLVTVAGTLNGNGIFNIVNVAISATSPGTFSVNLFGPDTVSTAENGSGLIFGTIFKFEPGQPVGSRSGGTIVTSGTIATGRRKICYSFLTRNGFMTKPSPILEIDVTAGTSGIVISNLLTGPTNVIARVIHITAAEGGNFYNIPEPVSVTDSITGQTTVNTSTWLNDNSSTSVTLSFSDNVLLRAIQIDTQGNNLFECDELGSCLGIVPYAQRLVIIGEQNKVANLLNYSFDGGVAGGSGSTGLYPAGWTVDPTSGAGGSVVASSIFGFAYQIKNSSGITQATYGMITQDAFQDEFMVDIIAPSTTYSVRLTAQAPAGAASGNLVVDLFSPSQNRALGTFALPLTSLSTTMKIFSGTLLTTTLAPVPNDLLLRVYATNIPNGVEIDIDRIEPFPTERPNLDTQVILSYSQNFESFDRLTGVLDASLRNQQPVRSAFVLFDTLYLVKGSSFISTNDNGTTEPNVAPLGGWILRTISDSVGTDSMYGVTTGIDQANAGEDWAIVAGQPGAYIFTGGEPIKLSEEIQQLWNQINWQYGHTLWIVNDIINRRALIGVPLKTPNKWLPTGIIPDNSNPTTPNVVLELNYKQLNTPSALASSVGVHKSFSGRLLASEITRKWSVWTIKSPCAAFIKRPDKTAPVFFGNSDATGKIYELVDNLLEDDGAAFAEIYTTSSFVPTETAQGMQLGVLRYGFDCMTMLIGGNGDVTITVYPNSLDSTYAHTLLPDLSLPASTNGDVELPLDEEASRLFLQFKANAVGAGFTLSRVVMIMSASAWSPYRGVNT